MRSARLRRQHQKVKQETKQPLNQVPESSQSPEKMVEEEDIPVQDQRSKMKQFFKEDNYSVIEEDSAMYDIIRERYNNLLKELVMNENTLKDFNFSDEEKKILNERVELWLEYFVSSATFKRGDKVNLFSFMDYFTETQKFI